MGLGTPDLSKYFDLRYHAFAAAFEVDLDECPAIAPQMPEWMETRVTRARLPRDEDRHRTIHTFTQSAERDSRHLSGPFDGYLEAPPELFAVYDQFAASIASPLTAARDAISKMLAALFVVLYPEAANRVISTHDLVAHGFDPRAIPPDPHNYL